MGSSMDPSTQSLDFPLTATNGIAGRESVTPTFCKNKIFVQIGVHIKMHIKL
jgi:hypothetical protein